MKIAFLALILLVLMITSEQQSWADHYTRCLEYGDPIQDLVVLDAMNGVEWWRHFYASSGDTSYVTKTRCDRYIIDVLIATPNPDERALLISVEWNSWIGSQQACEQMHRSYGVYAATPWGYERVTETFIQGKWDSTYGICNRELYSTGFAPAYEVLYIPYAPFNRYIVTAQADTWSTPGYYDYEPVTVIVSQGHSP